MKEYLYDTSKKGYYPIKVRIDGVVSGEIRAIKGGFSYFPLGNCGHRGIYSTISEVQKKI